MAERIFIHIGAPKSGTTYLQTLLWANKPRLAEAGVLVPGGVRFDHNRIAQAVRTAEPDPKALRAWARIVDDIEAWPGTVLLSNEWFIGAKQAQARRTVEAFLPAEIHVIATARDLVRTVPSAWQENLKLGRDLGLGDFVESLGQPGSRWKWASLDPSLSLPRWQASLPRGHVHLVTVATGGRPELLWERFSAIVGFPEEGLDLRTAIANESIGAESARLMQLVGPRLRTAIDAENIAWNETYRWIRDLVAHQLLVPQGGSRIGMRQEDFDAIRERSRASVRRLEVSGYDIVGDLDELVSAPRPTGARLTEDVTEAEVLQVSLEVMAGLLARVQHETKRADRATKRLAALEAAATRPRRLLGAPRRLR